MSIKDLRKAIARRLRNAIAPGARILMYHRVAEIDLDPWGLCVTPEHFAEHLEVLSKSARVVSLQQLTEELDAGKSVNRSIAITFDDGYADNLLNAKPILEKYDIPATVFVANGYVERQQEYWWDELERIFLQPGTLPEKLELTVNNHDYQWELGEAATYSQADYQQHQNWYAEEKNDPTPRHSLYRSLWQLLLPLLAEEQKEILDELRAWAGIKAETRSTHRPLTLAEIPMLESGNLIEVGSHTVMHPYLSALPISRQRQEIQDNKARLEEILGHPVTSFAYPYGNYTPETINLVQEAGFDRACSTISAGVRQKSDYYQLPRVEIQNWHGEEFARRLSRWFYV
ncbi:MAG: polysaccharide deacetylase family protein [Hydrococcus sp. SU_1_0]|nr:polysaccharide deacetylase family protein [Hydrococcus sp. SU_1_0]